MSSWDDNWNEIESSCKLGASAKHHLFVRACCKANQLFYLNPKGDNDEGWQQVLSVSDKTTNKKEQLIT